METFFYLQNCTRQTTPVRTPSVNTRNTDEWLSGVVAFSWLDSIPTTHCTCNPSSKYLMFYNVLWMAAPMHTHARTPFNTARTHTCTYTFFGRLCHRTSPPVLPWKGYFYFHSWDFRAEFRARSCSCLFVPFIIVIARKRRWRQIHCTLRCVGLSARNDSNLQHKTTVACVCVCFTKQQLLLRAFLTRISWDNYLGSWVLAFCKRIHTSALEAFGKTSY